MRGLDGEVLEGLCPPVPFSPDADMLFGRTALRLALQHQQC
jgi:hypothetical protein